MANVAKFQSSAAVHILGHNGREKEPETGRYYMHNKQNIDSSFSANNYDLLSEKVE